MRFILSLIAAIAVNQASSTFIVHGGPGFVVAPIYAVPHLNTLEMLHQISAVRHLVALVGAMAAASRPINVTTISLSTNQTEYELALTRGSRLRVHFDDLPKFVESEISDSFSRVSLECRIRTTNGTVDGCRNVTTSEDYTYDVVGSQSGAIVFSNSTTNLTVHVTVSEPATVIDQLGMGESVAVTLKLGSQLVLRRRVCGSNGFIWVPRETTDIVRQTSVSSTGVKDLDLSKVTEADMCGESIVETITYEASKVGQGELSFVASRPLDVATNDTYAPWSMKKSTIHITVVE